MTRSDSGIQLNSSNAKDIFKQVSVKKLKEIWENVAFSNGWKLNPDNINVLEVSDKMALAVELNQNPLKDRFDKCDMIVCGIKTIIVNQVKMHQIELGCHHCDSKFLMTAAHECEREESGGLIVQNGNFFQT